MITYMVMSIISLSSPINEGVIIGPIHLCPG
jgi:hypothetical protein